MITWGKAYRPRKRDGGHAAVRYGFGERSAYGQRRSYVRCECGQRLSGRGDEGGYRSWRRHQQRKAAASCP